MIKEYTNGQALLDENEALFATNPYLAVFFYWDAPLLTETGKINYALRVTDEEKPGKALVALKVEPYNLLLFGEPALAEELADYQQSGGYEIKNILCDCVLGEAYTRVLAKKYGRAYEEALPMTFMTCSEKPEKDIARMGLPDTIETPTEADFDEIVECLGYFIRDCGLQDAVNVEQTRNSLGCFRVIRADGRIASMAKFVDASDGDMKILDVYTRDEYRGRGFARKIVGAVRDEILDAGKLATLNVDRRNPITNHLYRALGFKELFAQAEYRPVGGER